MYAKQSSLKSRDAKRRRCIFWIFKQNLTGRENNNKSKRRFHVFKFGFFAFYSSCGEETVDILRIERNSAASPGLEKRTVPGVTGARKINCAWYVFSEKREIWLWELDRSRGASLISFSVTAVAAAVVGGCGRRVDIEKQQKRGEGKKLSQLLGDIHHASTSRRKCFCNFFYSVGTYLCSLERFSFGDFPTFAFFLTSAVTSKSELFTPCKCSETKKEEEKWQKMRKGPRLLLLTSRKRKGT